MTKPPPVRPAKDYTPARRRPGTLVTPLLPLNSLVSSRRRYFTTDRPPQSQGFHNQAHGFLPAVVAAEGLIRLCRGGASLRAGRSAGRTLPPHHFGPSPLRSSLT